MRFLDYVDGVWLFMKAALFWAVGPLNVQLGYLVFMLIADTVLGIMASRRTERFRLGLFFQKTAEKGVFYIVLIALFNSFDNVANLPGTARWLCLMGLAGLELTSSIKNISRLGWPALARVMEQAYRDIFRSVDATPVLDAGEASGGGEVKGEG